MEDRAYTLVERSEELEELARILRPHKLLVLDTESDSMYHYHYKICLLQLSEGTRDWLIDPLILEDISPLLTAIGDSELILHGSDYDLRMLWEGYHFRPAKVFDTMIAAQYLGFPAFGLSDLVKKYFGVVLDKGDQKANWSRRPLSESMKTYAALDTRFLLEIHDQMKEELQTLGRLHWLEQSCARLQEQATISPPEPDRDKVWRVKGSGRLSQRQLGILRNLWIWREKAASSVDRPPYQVMNNERMNVIAEICDRQKTLDNSRLPRLSKLVRGSILEDLYESIREGMATPTANLPNRRPPRKIHPLAPNSNRLEIIREKRDRLADNLEIDPTLVANRQRMVNLSLCSSTERDTIEKETGLMPWQIDLLCPFD